MTEARGLRIVNFYTVTSANKWLEENPLNEIFAIQYSAVPEQSGDSKHWILIAYKEREKGSGR